MPLSVAIAGAGPAGLAAGLLLARAGHRVVIHERFETPRPVGSGLLLQPPGLAVLDDLGLGGEMRAHGRPISRLSGRRASDGRVVLDVHYDALGAGTRGLAVHRSALFGVLHDAALRQGLAFKTGKEIAGLERAADGKPRLVDAQGRAGPAFDLLIDATGSHSPLSGLCGPTRAKPLAYGALWASLPWPGAPFLDDALEQRYRAASVMIGVLPVGCRHGEEGQTATFFWSLKAAAYDTWRERGLDAWKAEVLPLWPQVEPLLAGIDHPDQLALARYDHRTLARPFGERLAVIGDAAHSTSPQLGQGANMALIDAAVLAWALERHSEIQDALAAYARLRRAHVRLYQALSLALTPVYQSDSRILPLARDVFLSSAVKLPFVPALLAKMVAGVLIDPLAAIRD